MPTTMEDVTAKIDAVEIDPKSGLALKEKAIEGELKDYRNSTRED